MPDEISGVFAGSRNVSGTRKAASQLEDFTESKQMG
jgi:hypothetical protein